MLALLHAHPALHGEGLHLRHLRAQLPSLAASQLDAPILVPLKSVFLARPWCFGPDHVPQGYTRVSALVQGTRVLLELLGALGALARASTARLVGSQAPSACARSLTRGTPTNGAAEWRSLARLKGGRQAKKEAPVLDTVVKIGTTILPPRVRSLSMHRSSLLVAWVGLFVVAFLAVLRKSCNGVCSYREREQDAWAEFCKRTAPDGLNHASRRARGTPAGSACKLRFVWHALRNASSG